MDEKDFSDTLLEKYLTTGSAQKVSQIVPTLQKNAMGKREEEPQPIALMRFFFGGGNRIRTGE